MTNHTIHETLFCLALLYKMVKCERKIEKQPWTELKRKLCVCTHLLLLKIHFISYSYRKNWRTQLAKLNKDQSLTAASKKGTKILNRRLLCRTQATSSTLHLTAHTTAPSRHPWYGSINMYFINALDNNHTILTEVFAPGYLILLGIWLFAVNRECEIILNYLICTS